MMYVATALLALQLALGTPTEAPTVPGDDNLDGIVMEDESGWLCAEMGNLVCGPLEP